ncbi:MAG: glycogen/starch/alpha-glucan phosphorylase [Clostridiales bacterium]|nr:glycogen/starch/alpha-glucan phosphorylase [Clostridiales bacterium]
MAIMNEYNKDTIKESILNKLLRYYGCTIEEATPKQVYNAVASTVRDQIMLKWRFEKEARRQTKAKRLYYLSIEFLTGRWLHNNLLNLCATKEYEEAFKELGLTLRGVLHEEPEPALGNGGLGRLAACFLDSMATLDLPAMGCTIRYEYGLFRQRIVDGQQVEVPDEWLTYGNAWEIPTQRDAVTVRFGGHVTEHWVNGHNYISLEDTEDVIAVPYDLPIVGYNSDVIDRLRTWSAVLPQNFNPDQMSDDPPARTRDESSIAARISKVLYPEDDTPDGKKLRLMQEYFLVSATLQYAMKDFRRIHGRNMSLLPEKVAFHINDTHPALVIPELMRILVDEERLPWEEAERIVEATVAYTNHTIMAEALEKWPETMLRETLPRIYAIMQEMNRRLCEHLFNCFPGQWEKIGHMAILAYDQAHMANMCIAYSHAINGVSQLHGEILKRSTFHDYYSIMPEKFMAITNGITPRRWLMLANPHLSALLDEAIGQGWRTDLMELQKLLPLADDSAFQDRFMEVKRINKERFNSWINRHQGLVLDPDMMYDVQVKRLHEYKRQLLNALHILVLYNRICDDPNFTMPPRLFLFGAKAAPGYRRAKEIIHFINVLAAKIEKDDRANKMLRVAFLRNYNVSTAEVLIPASEVSEQLSTASKEASGTGNMKFMMNGAVTIGTLDGANVEIADLVGDDNCYIFGMRSKEVEALYATGSYRALEIYENNMEIRRALNMMFDGSLTPDNPKMFEGLFRALVFSDNGGLADPYLVLKDFGSYQAAQRRLTADYMDRRSFTRKEIVNVAMSGVFSSDRTIREYNEHIWHLSPLVKNS